MEGEEEEKSEVGRVVAGERNTVIGMVVELEEERSEVGRAVGSGGEKLSSDGEERWRKTERGGGKRRKKRENDREGRNKRGNG